MRRFGAICGKPIRPICDREDVNMKTSDMEFYRHGDPTCSRLNPRLKGGSWRSITLLQVIGVYMGMKAAAKKHLALMTFLEKKWLYKVVGQSW